MSRFRIPLSGLLLPSFALLLAACNEDTSSSSDSGNSEGTASATSFAHPKELTEGEDGLMRRNGEETPFTGTAIIKDRDWNLRYFAYYQKGKLHGPELKFWEDGTLRRNFDYEAGEKVRHREYFENGNPKIDATMVDGVALGRHRTWFEDGDIRWSGHFIENLLWDGPIIDYSADKEILWDAEFKDGRYVSGVYPEEAQDHLLKEGLITPEEAVYPIKETD